MVMRLGCERLVEMVNRFSGVDFKVEIAPRRPGDPARSLQLPVAPRDAGLDTTV